MTVSQDEALMILSLQAMPPQVYTGSGAHSGSSLKSRLYFEGATCSKLSHDDSSVKLDHTNKKVGKPEAS